MSKEPESSNIWLSTKETIERLKELNIEYNWRIPSEVFDIKIPNVELGKKEILTPLLRMSSNKDTASPQNTIESLLFALKKELAKIGCKIVFERGTFISDPQNMELTYPEHNYGIFGLMKFNYANNIANEEILLSSLIKQEKIEPPVFHSAAETLLTMIIHINWIKKMGSKDFPSPIMAGYRFNNYGSWKNLSYACAYYCKLTNSLEFGEIWSNTKILGFALNTYEQVGQGIKY